MSFFCCNKINLTKIDNISETLAGISYSLKLLSFSPVEKSRIMIGGEYHKKYYRILLNNFYDNDNIVLNAKNTHLSEFLYNLKYNICNFGLFFYREKESIILKIYSGNCVVLSKVQQNFIEKCLSNKPIIKENKDAVFTKYKNFYNVDFLNFKLICKNRRIQKAVKRTNDDSHFKVVVLQDLSYFVLYKNKKIDSSIFFTGYKKVSSGDDDLIEKLIRNNYSRVAKKGDIVYNKIIYNFDILQTLIKISEKTYDNNFRKLVLKTQKGVW